MTAAAVTLRGHGRSWFHRPMGNLIRNDPFMGWQGDAVDVELEHVGDRYRWTLYHRALRVGQGVSRTHRAATIRAAIATWVYRTRRRLHC